MAYMRKALLALVLCGPALTLTGERVRVMEWNVENLFDCQHDTLKDDWDFVEGGAYGWTWGRYWRKLTDLARVIMAVGDERPPELVGLCEVENDGCMRDLTRRSVLRHLYYDYVMTDGPDERGVDVALLYRPVRFRLLGYEAVRVPSTEQGLRPTRDVLHAWGVARLTGDTLHVVVCHLPSRTRGREGDRNRLLAAQTVANLVAAIGMERNIIVMGDFNAAPRDRIFDVLAGLTDLAPRQRRPKEGSYRFRGLWSWIDHVMVSPPLRDKASTLHTYTAPWLQEDDSNGGWHPRRTFTGPAYHGGVSDHVPIYADMDL